MNHSLKRRLARAEQTPDPGESYYLSAQQVEDEIDWILAGHEPRIEWSRVQASITHAIAMLHTEEAHGDVWWQQCGRCQARLAR